MKDAKGIMAGKQDRTPEEDDMLEMMLHGGNRVSEGNMEELLAWCNSTGLM